MTLKIDAKFGEKLICCFNNDKNFVQKCTKMVSQPEFTDQDL